MNKITIAQIALALLALLILLPLFVPLFVPWSEFNCKTLYIDVNSGRTRLVRHLYFIPVRDEVADTSCSRALFPDGNYPPPSWKPDTRLDLYTRNSPHYFWHGAVFFIKQIDAADSLSQVEKNALWKRILALWQSGKGKYEAKELLWDYMTQKEKGKSS